MSFTKNISINVTKLISDTIPEKSEKDLQIIQYGLEIFFMNIYKLVLIIAIAYYFNVLNITLYTFFLFGIVRTFASGAHATSWLTCTLLSLLTFIALPVAIKYIDLSLYMKVIIFIISFLLLLKYSPADTNKRPIKNKRKRRILRSVSLVICIIYFILSIILNDMLLSNIMIMSLFVASIMTSPPVYKILKNSYSQ